MSEMEVINLGSDSRSNKVSDKRRLVGYGIFDNIEPDKRLASKLRHLNFHATCLDYANSSNELIHIDYNQIDHIVISMCSRFHNWGVFSEFYYFIDLDIYYDNDVYKLEIHNMKNANEILKIISDNNIKYEDPIGVFELFAKHPDYVGRHRYLQANFKNIAKQFNLDNPRDPKIMRQY